MCCAAWKADMYSASHVDEATNVCLLDCQATRPCRQKATKPDVDRRVSRHDA